MTAGDAVTHGHHGLHHQPLPHGTRQVVHGTPITPGSALAAMAPTSFCLSYWNRRPVGPYVAKLDARSTLLLDSGAFSIFTRNLRAAARGRAPVAADGRFWAGYYAWALAIMRDVPQACLVVPDVIGGTVEENRRLILDMPPEVPADRAVPVWHLGEPLSQLEWIVEGFGHVAFGSSGRYLQPGTTRWRQRMAQAFDLVESLCGDPRNGLARPRVHLLRGLSAMARPDWLGLSTGDSTNLARNHGR